MDSNHKGIMLSALQADIITVQNIRETFLLFMSPDKDEGGGEIPPDKDLLRSLLVTMECFTTLSDHKVWVETIVKPIIETYSEYPETSKVLRELKLL